MRKRKQGRGWEGAKLGGRASSPSVKKKRREGRERWWDFQTERRHIVGLHSDFEKERMVFC